MSEQTASKTSPQQGKNQTSRLLLPMFVLLACAFFVGVWLYSEQKSGGGESQIKRLLQQQLLLKGKVAEVEALLSLRDVQIESMSQMMEKESRQKAVMQKRLDMFENILASRKVRGVHILQPSAYWQDEQVIAYDFILVKGENYPRKAIGKIIFSVAGPESKEIILMDEKGEAALAYKFVTHAFLQGSLSWKRDKQPESLMITLFNKRGKQISHAEIPIMNKQRGKR